ncbi:NACHT, LRR and PYD domains-containing protein 3-like isoform X22 [Brienomyrus brachyistius]|uniref:NACHT, LRR and PYD domains-containing protein 3-like isoform X15 n=2 Tax=Brienomyrus brachyistius TaxID=42636 RepID=UPI0020B302B5|nr:NACHT, LRR and PYD domains-containing protein 3-like isoform X15 [Brienomyrus brachyistius]XP_048859423.1 NACHT, LRR and PYD domains-containing protein 3-like isoform X16 [Brienomyrus brachyistius]XP_048859424.1 NACHT, LRR and PYD domains-containing protein 3-like isoform X17 [Brienomyrus brachyistius]XP_048859425.1 NACHT, LRR and PYD domains-containing protein 3-like isoform X18 [Brienomyrus brachyistius]XP_048859426.1 NACHT, LRR and PYD domains-containing protein 3-like isoform X19 [Brieno
MEKERRTRRASFEMLVGCKRKSTERDPSRNHLVWISRKMEKERRTRRASFEMLVGCKRKSTESVLMERADSPVPSCFSLKSDRSLAQPINFREGPFPTDRSVLMKRADSPVPSCFSLKSDRSLAQPINFREGPFPADQRDQMEECSSDLHDKSGLSSISKLLEEKAVKFLKDELKKFVRYLDQNYPECSEPQLEEDNDLDSDGQMQKTCGREGALKITLYILRTMKQNDLADMLEKRQLMLQYQQKIKCKLKRQFECIFEGKAMEGQPTLLNEIYTELYITEGGTGAVNDEHEVRQIETASKKRRTEDTTVKCNDIFKPLCGRETPVRTVLTKGVAGIGKTVSVQKFILDWAEGKANQDVHFIFALPFRDLNLIKEEYSLIELLHRFVPELKSLESTELFRYKVLFIFDGLDECRLPLNFQNNESWFDVTTKMSLDVLLTNLIKGNLLPPSLLWITSRPAAANQIPSKYVHQVTEIRGFSDAQKEEYFRKRFSDQSLASRIITHVKSSRSLFIMCHIPVFCWISATVLERIFSETDRGEIPRTLTEMYTHFLIFQTTLKNDKYMKNYETKLKKYSKKFLLKLGKLAFDNLEKGNLIFYEQDLTENGIDVTEASVYSGLCTEVFKEEYGLYREKVYCFVHLSIQEYLAALYVFLSKISTKLLKTAVDQALKSKNGHLDLYLRFLLGLSTDSSKTLLQRLLGKTRIGSHTIKEMEQYIHPSNTCFPVSSGLLGSEAFPQSSVPMAWNNPGWDASLSQPQYIHPSNVCPPVSSGLLGTEAFPQSSMPMAWNNPGWDASLSQPQYIHPSNVCPPVSSGLLGTEAFPQSSVPMTGTDLELGASLSLAEYIKKKIQKKLSPERTINLFHCLVELGDSSLIQEVQRYLNSGSLSAEDLSPAQYSALAFVMLMSDEELDVFDMKKYIRSDEEHWRLLPVVKNSRTALLNSCDLIDEHCEMLTSALRSNSSPLRELDLSDNDLKNKGVMLLSAGLGDSHCKLGLLRLSSCRVTEDGCSSLASALRSNPSHLRELDLSYNDLHDSGVKLLSAVLEDPSCKLEALRLSGCRVTEDGCSSLASALRSNPSHLRELDLSDNDLQDSGVKLLSAVLEEPSCKLEKLKMSGCRVTEEGCSSLASALRSNPSHLRELDLSYNHPGDSGVKLLSAVLEDPSCKLEKLNVDHGGECRTRPGLQKYSCQLTLDPNTANRLLSLSGGNRKVTRGAEEQPYPDHPERFDNIHQVLCRESLTGRCYWEAEWDGDGAWIGVTYKGIRRKEGNDCLLGFNNKSWCLSCDPDSYSVWHNYKQTLIPIRPSGSRRVGVYLDWGAGALSFYRVSSDGLTPLYRLTSSFTESLYPGFYVHNSSVSL